MYMRQAGYRAEKQRRNGDRMKKNDIYVIQGTDYKQMAFRILESVEAAKDIGDKRKRIGIKPNLLGAIKAEKGATTHPELVDGVLSYLTANGFSNLAVLEGSWVGDQTLRSAKYTGIYDICKKYQVPFIDLQKDSYQTVDAAGMPIAVCSEALKVDYLINMPVLKGHCQTTVTCALKNSKGLIPNFEKRRFHTMGLHEPIAHLNTVIHQDFILVDNICGDLDFEEGGNPVVMNRVLGLKDPVLCDSYAAEIMGYRPHSVKYIRLAEELGIGSTDVAHANIIPLNEGALDVTEMHKTPRIARLSSHVSAKDACSACYGSLIYALSRLEENGRLNVKNSGTIAVGQGYRGMSGKIGIGQCTKCFEKNLGGCPPKAVDIVDFLQTEWLGIVPDADNAVNRE